MIYRILFLVCCGFSVMAQETEVKPYSLDANFFYGTILQHNKDIAHLITGHPTGVILSYNRMTYGFNDWEARYNYPDYGFSFIAQDQKNENLGQNFGLYGHFNFYALNRRLMLRIGQGIAATTKPFDLDDNFRNNAYGSTLLSSTFVMVNYRQPNIIDRIGLQTGISLIHYSNANVKAPNASTNSFTFNLGLNYQLDKEERPEYIPNVKSRYTEPLKLNLVLRGGVNESDYIGLGQRPFLVTSAFADKRITHKSTLQAGVDFFLSPFLKDQIEYESIALERLGTTGDEDWKRFGVFLGHELRFNKNAFVTQFGYYAYYDYDFEGRVYFRGGLKRYFTDKIFGAITLKSHGAKAEAVEFGIGYRF
ncbi:acyloxyacyl hydrolase [Leeuwenhoekiella nanhaiensis]|uniref:Deacylase n=1 Tax=Leeuwenhoekiella nanhaiensis TaxID=1655491 RepID=A0A2G1VT84_9FLAO|nr:acyloxyacyl hydrolase [Leeuwenhoekiella nanhaiensis]PHQ30003.1 deacylase [Leeuwenhoekiella nanhaiensis]